MSKLVIGCGYLGSRVARRWREAGDDVFVVTRSTEHARQFERDGYRPIVADVTLPHTLAGLPAAEIVLYAVGYDHRSGRRIDEVYAGGLRNVLDALSEAVARIVYISSTGVYGDCEGDWVDEDTPCRPTRPGGIASLAAEETLAAHRHGSRAIVLRLAGIYGPGRIPRAAALLAGEPIPAPAQGFLNLIHVDDAVSVALTAERHVQPPRRYLVSDGNPGQRREYYEELARLLGAPPPRFVPPEHDSPAAARAASDKRASNSRLLAELPVLLRYPSFREGLAQIVQQTTSEKR